MNDVFDNETIKKHLRTHPRQLVVFDVTESTNKTAMEMAADGAPETTVVVAAAQTAGRGRLGRSFYSPSGSGVYISEIFRPDAPIEAAALLTTAAAVAVCRAIEGLCPKKAYIKWVNDIYMDDKKVCGILTQGVAAGDKLGYAVVGIGINLLAPEGGFPDDISTTAGCVFDAPFCDMRARLTAAVIDNLASLCTVPLADDVVAEYRSRSWLDGCEVDVITPQSRTPAVVIGIDENCALTVRYEDGTTASLSSGEVSIRKAKK